MKYMILMNASAKHWGEFGKMSPDDIMRHIGFMNDLNVKLKATGEYVDAQGLTLPNEAMLVQAKTGGPPAVTDGPFPESKEFLAGFWILDVKSKERIVEIAAGISAAPGPGGAPMNFPVEVRAVGVAPKV